MLQKHCRQSDNIYSCAKEHLHRCTPHGDILTNEAEELKELAKFSDYSCQQKTNIRWFCLFGTTLVNQNSSVVHDAFKM